MNLFVAYGKAHTLSLNRDKALERIVYDQISHCPTSCHLLSTQYFSSREGPSVGLDVLSDNDRLDTMLLLNYRHRQMTTKTYQMPLGVRHFLEVHDTLQTLAHTALVW